MHTYIFYIHYTYFPYIYIYNTNIYIHTLHKLHIYTGAIDDLTAHLTTPMPPILDSEEEIPKVQMSQPAVSLPAVVDAYESGWPTLGYGDRSRSVGRRQAQTPAVQTSEWAPSLRGRVPSAMPQSSQIVDHEYLVSSIKMLQRTIPRTRQAWILFCHFHCDV